ncbi:MAG: beta-L-arabinofuranosidase domain-containing protein, partial [Planctomycetota bacterium]
GVVALLATAQQPDGYLNTHYTPVEPDKRWSNLRDCHELYCAGHLMEAAVAHFNATGRRALLDVMCRYADYIGSVFGRSKGKRRGYPGHEEIELALVKLYRATGEKRYLRLSKYFVDERGRKPHYYDKEAKARGDDPASYWARTYDYCQADKPVREQAEAVGHAVRAMYLYSGMADVAAETGDAELLAACRRLWRSVVERKMYVTGGVGASHRGEAFGADYDLPNEEAYAETCAAIGLVFWAHRMLQINGDGQYADVMERALYNGFLAGVGLGGKHFFYVNPLAHSGEPGPPRRTNRRQPWFGCACCPSNVVRLLASLGGYVYSATPNELYVHLYIGGEGRAVVAGQGITLRQATGLPRSGDVRLEVDAERPARFAICLRLPAWSPRAAVRINGKRAPFRVRKGYARIARTWRPGDRIDLRLEMPILRLRSHPAVVANAGRVALQRGPLVYCLEEVDHNVDVRTLALPASAKLKAAHKPRLLAGVTVLCADGFAPRTPPAKDLYRTGTPATDRLALTAVPYYAWANRAPGSMAVWLLDAD